VVLTKPEIDKANKDHKHKKYPEDFKVELRFEVVDTFKHNLYSILDSLDQKFTELNRLIEEEETTRRHR